MSGPVYKTGDWVMGRCAGGEVVWVGQLASSCWERGGPVVTVAYVLSKTAGRGWVAEAGDVQDPAYIGVRCLYATAGIRPATPAELASHQLDQESGL